VVVVVSDVVDGLVDVVSSVVVVLVCANANGATNPQTKAMIVLFTLMPPSLLGLPPQFVAQGSSGRSLCDKLFSRLVLRRFEVCAISAI